MLTFLIFIGLAKMYRDQRREDRELKEDYPSWCDEWYPEDWPP